MKLSVSAVNAWLNLVPPSDRAATLPLFAYKDACFDRTNGPMAVVYDIDDFQPWFLGWTVTVGWTGVPVLESINGRYETT